MALLLSVDINIYARALYYYLLLVMRNSTDKVNGDILWKMKAVLDIFILIFDSNYLFSHM